MYLQDLRKSHHEGMGEGDAHVKQKMEVENMIRAELKAPRAGAIAGIVFSILLIISLVIFRLSIPANPDDAGKWLPSSGRSIRLALNLLPFAGIAFLWFIGVLRDRMGELEDRFFATVFLGSGLLFLTMLLTFQRLWAVS
jgi:hypothetical protein